MPSGAGPKHSSVLKFINNLSSFCCLAKFKILHAPTTLSITKLKGSSIDLSTWLEAAKCQIGFDEKKAGGNLRRILAEPLNELCKQVREAKYFYGEHFDSKDLKAIYVTGGGSYLPGLLKCVAEHSGLKVEPGNPLANISQGSLTIPDSKLQTFTTALGLALRQYE